jgi:DNA-3-methyladenine glycosylase II
VAVRATRKAVEHLREADPVMAGLIDSVGKLEDFRRRVDLAGPGEQYAALVRSIVGQQLSTSAARSIWLRLVAYFGGHAPTPQEVLDADPEAMRTAAGLSHAKVKYLRSLAEHVLDGSLALDTLDKLSDADVIEQLTAVSGIGTWSSHMFLMFQLDRPDVLASGDLGIRRAVERAYGLAELPPPAEVERIGAVWSPYRTLACLYLWSSLRIVPV